MKLQSAAKTCRACHERPAIRRGPSVRLCGACLAKPAGQRMKPERPPTPAYKLTRAVSRHGTTNPSIDIGKGNHRDRGLLDLAHEVHECTNCGRHVVHGCEPAHENGIEAGKGQSIKGSDWRHFAACHACHLFYDSGSVGMDPSGRYTATFEDKRELFNRAHLRTFDLYWRNGWIKVAA